MVGQLPLWPDPATFLYDDNAKAERVTGLCSRCEALDLTKLFAATHVLDTFEIQPLLRLGRPDELRAAPDCRLCQFLLQIAPDGVDSTPSGGGLALVRLSSLNLALYCSTDRPSPLGTEGMFAVADCDFLQATYGHPIMTKFIVDGPILGASGARVIRHDQINYDWLRDWIEQCRENHVPCRAMARERLHEVRLIDCRERRIVLAAENDRYAALSYVWGSGRADECDLSVNSILPASLPRLIEDAMTVTQELGLHYLWVDRYCIGGGQDSLHRMKQIQQMHQIYRQCVFTIVAAAGNDPSYGLPGVSRVREVQQTVVSLGSVLCTTLTRPPTKVVDQCLWNTRGWTYQEAIFSRNRVYFTDEQVYVECVCSRAAECTSIPLLGTDWRSVDWEKALSRVSRTNGFANIRQPLESSDIMSHIAAYSRRSLTYDFDAINGISAVLRLFENQHRAVHQFQGIPIMPSPRMEGDKTGGTGWSVTDRFLAGLCWRPLEPGRRRKGFPSWSWAGWTSPLHHDHDELKNKNKYMSQLPLSVVVETGDQRRMDLEMAMATGSSRDVFESLSSMIWIKGPVVDLYAFEDQGFLRCSPLPPTSTRSKLAQVNMELLEGSKALSRSQEVQRYTKPGIRGLIISQNGFRPDPITPVFVMLIQQAGDTTYGLAYERCGHVDLYTMFLVGFYRSMAIEETILLM